MSLAETAPLTSGKRHPQASVTDDNSYDDSTPRAIDPAEDNDLKRNLFGVANKKAPLLKSGSSTEPPSLSKESSKMSSIPRSTASPTQFEQVLPSSPNRAFSASPRMASPAGSQIFERDVQDSTAIGPSSPAIPTHIQTENYIPSVLDDASEAITNEKLDPDSVEIVTHSSHQPAAIAVTGSSYAGTPNEHSAGDWVDELDSFSNRAPLSGDNASNYGSLDSADVRRLSFISFADVVQSEQSGVLGTAGSRDSFHLAGLTSLNSAALNRSPSPIRSPVSSQGPGTSPPTSNPASVKGLEMSPSRKPLGSPSGHVGDLNIETMSQALRRTGSADLGQVRSGPHSPI